MSLEFRLVQKLNQQMLMTPELQQAIKLLQYGKQELKEAIEKELQENPVLEDLKDTFSTQDNLANQNGDSQNIENANGTNDMATYQDRFSDYSRNIKKNNKNWGEDTQNIENTAQFKESLSEHLLNQVRLLKLSKRQDEVCLEIILNLNSDGYLALSYEELEETYNLSREEIVEAINIIKELDPIGIGARNARECLSFQLEVLGRTDSLAMKLINNHLENLANKKYDLIAKTEDVDIKDILEALKEIKTLSPFPGRTLSLETTSYITPDIYVYKDNGKWKISLNDDDMPELRINPEYASLAKDKDVIADKEGKDFLTEKIKSASWLIKSIQQRQDTIFKVTKSIVKFQSDFLEKGVSALKPMVLKDVATDIEMHESTVSRVTTNKYVHTPQGIFELKYFFTSGLKNEGDVSTSYIKELIRQLISKEDSKSPISDQEIVEKLSGQGIKIARRTVAKYREGLGILSSSKRKELF